MCCFSPVGSSVGLFTRLFGGGRIHVAETRIFGRLDGDRQHLVYSMSLSTPADVAMLLPVPIALGLGDGGLDFVDLSGYPQIFSDLSRLVMPELTRAQAKSSFALPLSAPRPKLVVHSVGAFDASFVPSIGDFDRLDERFRLPDDVWAARPEYRDFGFAVFKLAKTKQKKAIHPMAFSFRTREPEAIYFPTLHVHDGQVHERATFDHELFFQIAAGRADRPDGHAPFQRSWGPAREVIPVERTKGIVAPDAHVELWTLRGKLANTDTRVRPQ